MLSESCLGDCDLNQNWYFVEEYMLLKSLMEDKQLDFNQPLLSVRRFSSTAAPSEAQVKKKTDNSLPKIPPLPVYKSELKSGPIRNPGSVPFLWEQTPGRPKDEGKSQTRSIERPPIAPKLPPGRISNIKPQALEKVSEGRRNNKLLSAGNVVSSSQSASSPSDKNTVKCESSAEGMDETRSSRSEDGNEAYADALDTLSRTESFFFNCSVSGVSGLDDEEMKPSGTFSSDQWTRDFMMTRFLPAAKAIASGAPQHKNRKQPVTQELPRNIQRVVNMDRRPPPKQYSPNSLQFHAQDKKWEESDDEDDYDGPGNSSATVCGFLPPFCLKTSFCLLNPVPGMRLQAQQAVDLAHRAPARGSYASSYCEIPEKAKNFKVNKSDPERKGSKIFRELLVDESTNCETGLAIPVEKTLYIDSVHKMNSPKSNSSSLDAKRLSDIQGDDFDALIKSEETVAPQPIDASLQDIKVSNVTGEKAISHTKCLKPVYSDFLSSPDRCSHGLQADAKSSSREDQDLGKNSIKLASPKMDGSEKIDLESHLRKKLSNQAKAHGRILKSVSSATTKIADGIKTDFKTQPQVAFSSQEESLGNYSKLPLSLPPPKSPSDSWLKRTLPTFSVKNSSPWSCIGTDNYRIQASKTAPLNPKWETIVKTSNVQHGHLRFSEVILQLLLTSSIFNHFRVVLCLLYSLIIVSGTT